MGAPPVGERQRFAETDRPRVDQGHPLGAAEGPGRSFRRAARGPAHAAPGSVRALPMLAAQVGPSRPLSAPPAPGRPVAPGLVAGVGVPVPHPRVREAVQDHQGQSGPNRRGGRARPFELQARGAQQQDPTDQPPWLGASLRCRADRDDLPLLRRNHRPATHR